MKIRTNFLGGNIIVTKIEDKTVHIEPDLRDTGATGSTGRFASKVHRTILEKP